MLDEAMARLLDYDRRRYWLANGWSVSFRVQLSEISQGRPHGVKYAFVLHDVDGTRLLGFDNAHGLPRRTAFDHRHRFRRTSELVGYDWRGADELIADFFAAVTAACRQEGAALDIVGEDVAGEDHDEAND